MTGCERTKGEPERRRLRELTPQFVAEEKIVERNQHDPVRPTDNTQEQKPYKRTAKNVADLRRMILLRLRVAQMLGKRLQPGCRVAAKYLALPRNKK
jgi:hypothetical protein